ncbi:MarR family transcriptional regulator [Paenibacillaceae bacterium]|nr:MarR family transcriptional regulator [Paenibacillaceae bacterium]
MKDFTHISQAIKHYSDAINTLMLSDISQLLNQQFSDLTQRQMSVVLMVSDRARTINEIANHFSITASAASQLIKKLEKAGYVKRDINLNNRREIIVTLDRLGEELSARMTEMDMYIIEKYYMKFDEQELVQLLGLLKKLHQIASDVQNKA